MQNWQEEKEFKGVFNQVKIPVNSIVQIMSANPEDLWKKTVDYATFSSAKEFCNKAALTFNKLN